MKKRIFILLIIFIMIGTFSLVILNYNKKELKTNSVDQKENVKTEIKSNDDITEIKEKSEEKTDVVETTNKTKKEESKSSTTKTETKVETKTETKKEVVETKKESTNTTTNNNNNVNTNTNNTNNTNPEENNETVVEQPKEETKKYIGVPSPNSYYYSFHHGKIEYSSTSSCEANSDAIMEKDVDDIYGGWCMEVQDDNGTVLGAYLYLKCYSGNCDKYKN